MQKRGDELEAALAARDAKLKEVTLELRERGARVKALETDLRRASNGAASSNGASGAAANGTPRRNGGNGANGASPANGASRANGAANGRSGKTRRAAPRDDLTAIHGIGPVLGKKLNKLGVRTYGQLAALRGEALESLAESLGTTTARIRREKWIPAAERSLKAKAKEQV